MYNKMEMTMLMKKWQWLEENTLKQTHLCLRRFFLFLQLVLLFRVELLLSYFSGLCRQGDGGNMGGPVK